MGAWAYRWLHRWVHMDGCIGPCMHTCMQSPIHASTHPCIYKCIQTYAHPPMHTFLPPSRSVHPFTDPDILDRTNYVREHAAAAKAEIRRSRAAKVAELGALGDAHEQQLVDRGVPNLIGARRFSAEELGHVAAIFSECTARRHTITSPVAPAEPVRIMMCEVAAGLGPSCTSKRQLPWWCNYICKSREQWHCSAVGVLGEEGAEHNRYLFLYAKEQPHEAMFLELRPRAVECRLGLGEDEAVFVPPAHRTEYDYLDPLRIFAEHAVPICDEAEIVVYRDVRLSGRMAASNSAPVDFDEFVRDMTTGMDATQSGGHGARRPREAPCQQSALAELIANHPWLSAEDLFPAKKKARPARGAAAGDEYTAAEDGEVFELESDAAASDAEGDAGMVDVDAELAAVRADLAAGDEEADEFYTLRILGGRWTLDHIGVAADAAMAAARGGLASAWATAHHFPKTRRFNFNKYGREAARMLALEVCRGGNFCFCNQYYQYEGDYSEFRHTAAMNAEYQESPEWLDWCVTLDPEDPSFRAMLDIRALEPRVVAP